MMSDVISLSHRIDDDMDLSSGFLPFSSVEDRIVANIGAAKTLNDADKILLSIGHLLKSPTYSQEDRTKLNGLMDRVCRLKNTLAPKDNFDDRVLKSDSKGIPAENIGFWFGVGNALRGIDGEAFAKRAPGFIGLVFLAVFITYLLWEQSTLMYQAIGFQQADLIALGAIALVCGSALLFSTKPSKFALALCLYAGTYEILFIVGSSVDTEQFQVDERVRTHPQMALLSEKSDRLFDNYQLLKKRYSTPGSKVFQNGWYKKVHLDPAWAAYEEASIAVGKMKDSIAADQGSHHIIWLKVMYRLGLALLSMMLIHRICKYIPRKEGRCGAS